MAKRILILLLLAGVLMAPEDLSSCGPFLPETVFTNKLAPLDEAQFFGGHLGILQPRYRRIYLMAAYRYLTGIGLSAQDQKALLASPTDGSMLYQGPNPVQAWMAARVQVGAPPAGEINPMRWYPGNIKILNCGDDAFRNAAATLVERGRAGTSHDELRAWVAAQDQVFANCNNGAPWQTRQAPVAASIPEALPDSAGAGARADRAYQIAAARFYAGQFDAAYADFARIAGDRGSPWHAIGPYLAARALVRKATLLDAGAAPAAAAQLNRVVADPEAAAWHESARGLVRFLNVNTNPAGALGEAAQIVRTQKQDVASSMNDYRLMLDHYESRSKAPPRDDEITDWIASMQTGTADPALERWRARHTLPWLVAAMTYARQPDAELMRAAAAISDESPAFATVEFHRLRLLPAEEARPMLDALLSRKLAPETRNLFLAERMRVSRNWEEWLRFAPRAGMVDGAKAEGRYFDEDSARVLDGQVSLEMLKTAASTASLPANLRLELARALWVRAVLLHDGERARGIAPELATLAPYLKRYLDLYLAAPHGTERDFEAAWLMLNNPGMRPTVDAGAGRSTPVPKLDNVRDNWWCLARHLPREPLNAPLELLYQGKPAEAGFLREGEQDAAERGREALDLAPAAPTWMAQATVAWAEAHPQDARAPEALRLVVRAGHYACGQDDATAQWMKRAFRLLHGRYPHSEAARLTPYWYGR